MRSPIGAMWPGWSLAGAVLVAGSPASATLPVILSAENAATSVWDTDASKVGVELQIVNNGGTGADDVRVTSVKVQGGALSGPPALPIALGSIGPRGSALLDLVIAVPRADGTAYLLTISGTYRNSGAERRFSLTRTVAPNAAAPAPIVGQSGVSTRGSTQPAGPVQPPAAGGQPPLGPNATTPMLIPPGPPRQVLPANPGEISPSTEQR